MTTQPTASFIEPSEQDWADADRAFTAMSARSLVEKAMTAQERIELTLAFGLKPDQALLDAAKQEAYALDHAIANAMVWM
jgi:hypothetical protein